MSARAFHLVGIVHGSIGAAALCLLLLSTWLLRRGETRAFTTGLGVGSALMAAQVALGLVLHEHWQARVRGALALRAPQLVAWLEHKENLAVGAVCLAWCALGVCLASRARAEEARRRMVRASMACTVAAALLVLVSFAVGTLIAVATIDMG